MKNQFREKFNTKFAKISAWLKFQIRFTCVTEPMMNAILETEAEIATLKAKAGDNKCKIDELQKILDDLEKFTKPVSLFGLIVICSGLILMVYLVNN